MLLSPAAAAAESALEKYNIVWDSASADHNG